MYIYIAYFLHKKLRLYIMKIELIVAYIFIYSQELYDIVKYADIFVPG